MDIPVKSDNMMEVNGVGGNSSDYTTDDSSESISPDDGSSSQDQTTEEIPTTSDDVQNDSYHHSRREESVLFSEIDKMRLADVGVSDTPNGTDGVPDTEVDRQCQNHNGETSGQGRNAFTHFTSEWSSLLDKIEDSVEKVSKNYEGWRPETVGQQTGNSYWQYQTDNLSTPGTSKSSVPFMSEEQADKWASAPEFHPAFTSRTGRVKTYAEAVDPYAPRTQTKLATGVQFCPYYHVNRAELYLCPYLHGELCQICLNTILDFEDTEEKREHIKGCLGEQEKRMKMSLAIQKSKGITCNICLEPVKEKTAGEARFGLLPNCNHCFCITCIRKWRQETRFTSQITRSCPICRVESPFVCPSSFWVETPEEKAAVITNYKKALRVKPCRLYNFGKGKCPFGDKCFYLHTLPDGTKPDHLDFRRPKRINAEGLPHFQDYVLWDFIAMRDDPENYQPSVPSQYPQSLDSSSTESDVSY
ncbi:probable E3 ubiquitin-protein ligase makorin-1 [Schistocerca americana]|uniref:probable E3 ubiquitin-protein ligase makorin-1 n=1 Tax=Schistocerca americana TaxID=7009 RepID=UPI001F4F76FB|nr:probable E3 ubiquitin-protein ligase makorin-1 [Schistocerca americana]